MPLLTIQATSSYVGFAQLISCFDYGYNLKSMKMEKLYISSVQKTGNVALLRMVFFCGIALHYNEIVVYVQHFRREKVLF